MSYIINPFLSAAQAGWDFFKPRFDNIQDPAMKGLQNFSIVAGAVGTVAGLAFKAMGFSPAAYQTTISVSATLLMGGVLGSYALMIGPVALLALAGLGVLLSDVDLSNLHFVWHLN